MDWYWKRESGGGTMPKEVASCIAIESVNWQSCSRKRVPIYYETDSCF